MIKLNVSAANIAVEEKETLTEGRVGLLCQFRFTDEWTGLAKTAVFDGADSRDVILKSDTVAIPAECLAAEGYSLSVGVYGKNAAGDIVIPTVYATVGKIQRSAYPSGKETAEPTPDVVAQIQQTAANAEELARSVREDADLGKFNGGKGEKGEKGDKGDKGPAGEAGGWYTPAVTQPNANTMRLSFTPSKKGMPAVAETDITLPYGGGGGGSGGSGEDGGYYTPAVTQTTENTMQVVFTPSKTTMPAVDGKEITLPDGPRGEDGKTPVKGTDYWTAADKQEIIDDIQPAYYIDLAGEYPNYTCSVAMDDIKAAYNSGYNLVCRFSLGIYTATLPLFVPKPAANTWIFSGSGALAAMNFPAQSMTIAIVNGTVQADNTLLASTDDIPTIPTALKNPNALTFTGAVTGSYDGSTAKTVNIPSAVTDDHINSLIDTKLGVIENGAY